jgi:hypothetical protein
LQIGEAITKVRNELQTFHQANAECADIEVIEKSSSELERLREIAISNAKNVE